jgi:O-methyltransferase
MLLDLGVVGDFVECGVFAGTHPCMMARAILDHYDSPDHGPKVHLFDSFEGIPEATEQDEGCYRTQKWEKLKKGTACSSEQVQIYMNDWGIPSSLLVYHKGWYEDVLPKVKPFPVALLRVDCDLYTSCKLVLQHVYPNLVEQGICIFDDYAFPGARLGFFEATSPGTISPIMWQRR